MGYITMNDKEREQSKVFEQVVTGKMNQTEAAAKLRISDRWVRKKLKRYRQDRDKGLVHKSRGKVSSKRWGEDQAAFSLNLLRSDWIGFGPTFAVEKLEELHNIRVSRETLRNRMISAGVWTPKQRRMKHRKRRERKAMRGMMVQLDGSPHDWFEGRAGKCTLLVFIDDATSEILWLEFANAESVESLMRATKNYIARYGIPQTFYTDHGSVFHVNLNNLEGDKKTQWERACQELGITVIHADSPQAKGRVERCNKTMQDRLIKEMRLAGVSSIDEANRYLRESNFIAKHNAAFAVKAAQEGNAHADHTAYNLNDIFSVKEQRVLNNDYTIVYQKRIFQLHAQQRTIIRPKNTISVHVHLDGTIKLWARKTELAYHEIKAKPQPIQEKKIVNRQPTKPCTNSRRWVSGLYPLSPQESRVNARPAGGRGV
jgi:hypothetical protein